MLKCVLVDSNIIIEAHELGIWEKLIDKVEISVSSIVAHTESLFYSKKEGSIPGPINLKRLITEGKIKEFSATQDEIAVFLNTFDSVFVESLHDGENESLALIMHKKLPDTFFCSSDAAAIKALAMIECSENGISFEKMLKKTGLQQKLRRQFTEKFFQDALKLGAQNLITGQGLK
ncbi:MAG: hypothetical protein JRJ39_14850 [Deltaproteobacteria bacterium]|nr:hypothetical protein [Deltaproteobacteria bacterium]MBW2364368.1 hypothetical protein [Deltaproteobacteria bacterium]